MVRTRSKGGAAMRSHIKTQAADVRRVISQKMLKRDMRQLTIRKACSNISVGLREHNTDHLPGRRVARTPYINNGQSCNNTNELIDTRLLWQATSFVCSLDAALKDC
jgi:hypothetical protein